MFRPLSLLPALGAVAAAMWALPGSPAAAAAAPADPDAALTISIDTLSPAVVPDRGRVTVTGEVTNTDDVPWSTINLYPFISTTPLTTRTEIGEAVLTEPSVAVGERVTSGGPAHTIDELDPGETARYSVSVRTRDLREHVAARGGDLATGTGVYWFGVHAIGQSVDNDRDGGPVTADGRARTFLPRMRGAGEQETALVVPLRSGIDYLTDGSLADPAGWAERLAPGGDLASLVELGEAADGQALTWMVDPALSDAVTRLAAGNPARTLGATLDPEATEDPDALLADPDSAGGGPQDPGEPQEGADPESSPSAATGSAVPSAPPTETDGAGGDAEAVDEPTADEVAAAEAATAWLGRLEDALDSQELLALPYGDLDVAGAAEHDPEAYARARQRSGETLQPWGLPTRPALRAHQGYLDLGSIELADEDETLVGTDRMVPELGQEAPAVATVAGRRVLLASTAAATGGPGPDDPRSGVAVRQRILAEAAVRRLARPREPLVVALPSGWAPDDPEGFFEGLDQPWLDLVSAREVLQGRATAVPTDQLAYPRAQARLQRDADDFASADALSEAGTTLQYLLTRNDTVGREVGDQALTSLSYAHRADADSARAVNDRSRARIEAAMADIRIAGPRQVTLSSASGRFSATLENGLDQPVTVRVRAVAEEPITITMSEQNVLLPPHSRRSVLLTATTERQGVHNVTLQVTDMAGTVVGSSDRLPIRAAQVSNVIWLIIATGAALLFGAIGLRLVRRLRRSRRTPGPGDPAVAEAGPAEQTPTPA